MVLEAGLDEFVRTEMTQQAALFFTTQALVFLGARAPSSFSAGGGPGGDEGKVWVSALYGPPGFVSAPHTRRLVLGGAGPREHDPLRRASTSAEWHAA